MPTEKVKTIKINLNLTDTNVFKNETYESNETFWTTDVNSAFLEFTTTNDLTNSIASLVLKNIDDGSLIQRNIETNESPFFYKLRDQEIIRAGRWYGQIVLESDGKSLTAAVFRFKIKGSLLDSSSPALVDIDNYRKLSDQLTTLYDQMNTYLANVTLSEEAREAAEAFRRTLFEESQKAREVVFIQSEESRSEVFSASENNRENLFNRNEEDRQSNESARVLAEYDRRTEFEESQTNRTTAFNQSESSRTETFNENENVRKSSEIERISNEDARILAESNREATFAENEVERSETFATNEADRKAGEVEREQNEETRQLNETERAETFETYDGRINGVENELLRLESEKANRKQEEWITPTLLNGWESSIPVSYQKAGYYKDDFGFVHLKGQIINGTSSSLFQLPVGYRPKEHILFSVPKDWYGGVCPVEVTTAYVNIRLDGTGNLPKTIHLGSISFKAEQ